MVYSLDYRDNNDLMINKLNHETIVTRTMTVGAKTYEIQAFYRESKNVGGELHKNIEMIAQLINVFQHRLSREDSVILTDKQLCISGNGCNQTVKDFYFKGFLPAYKIQISNKSLEIVNSENQLFRRKIVEIEDPMIEVDMSLQAENKLSFDDGSQDDLWNKLSVFFCLLVVA